MKLKVINWRVWFFGGFLGIILFVWASEVADLPHLLLNAPKTPVNWKESTLESIVTLIAGMITWELIRHYEREWRKALEEVRHLASTDDLTGTLNRRECMARFKDEFHRSVRFERPLALAIIDFDNFKAINDLYGHQIGDNVLKGFSDVVRNNVRAQDFFGRTGGDEFLLVLVETNEKDAFRILDRIREQWVEIGKTIIPANNRSTTVSVGLTVARADDQTLEICIRRADKALYLAKAKGRNQIQIG